MLHHEIEDNPSEISKLYGITQDPKTKNYMIVLHSLRKKNVRNLSPKLSGNCPVYL